MPDYDYKCEEHGYFEQFNKMVDNAKGNCPTCGATSKHVILSAPKLMVESMADNGFPGALHTSGDRMTKRHTKAGQYHTSTKGQEEANAAHEKGLHQDATVTPA